MSAGLHKPHSWLNDSLKHDPQAKFLALTRDVCRGIELCLEVATMERIDIETESPTLFSPDDLERLLLLATASARMLADRAETDISHMNDATPHLVAGGAA